MTLFEGLDLSQTIAAISTPVGMGGIGVLRLSGPLAHDITKKIFIPKSHSVPIRHREMVLGDIVDSENDIPIDEVFAVFMFAPHTYTREDMTEIQCHSGRVVLERILKLLLRQGARLAGPGEFTLRAFLNERIDLTQAEGVIEVIQAQSEASLKMAQKQLHGGIREAITPLLRDINEILTYMEADLDFSEDMGIDFTPTWKALWKKKIPHLQHGIDRLMGGYATCQMVREGFEVVIIGTPNVGKSSILNRFLGKDRAIVTEFPGTTRDFIEEGTLIQGIPFRIVDTAGLRESRDPVEQLGTTQSLHKKHQADIVLFVIDAAKPLGKDEIALLHEVEAEKTILILNKCDLPQQVTPEKVMYHLRVTLPIVEISAKTGQNWEKMTYLLVEKIHAQEFTQDIHALIPINQRHYQLLEKAKTALSRLDEGIRQNLEEVFLSHDLWEAKRALEAITGEVPDDDILTRIFQNFCVGK
jgi:tRNA modification GTPase